MWLLREKRGAGGMDWEFGISRCKLIYIEYIYIYIDIDIDIDNEVLLYSTENYNQYPMINHNGKEY